MPLYRAFLQTLGATLLLAMALACHSKHNNSATAANAAPTISGIVTYARVPLSTDANGVPTGLVDATVAANLKVLPARGVVVRAFQQVNQTQPDGITIKTFWTLVRTAYTDSTGAYSLAVARDLPTMVEISSTFSGGTGSPINLIAEPKGINSDITAPDRLRYGMRKAADNTTTSGITPTNITIPNSPSSSSSVVNFSVGLNDEWWLVNPIFTFVNSQYNATAPFLDKAILETDPTLPGRTPGLGSGSRILGIGDTIASFVAAYGIATAGAPLDLHYWPGLSEARGSFIEYNRSLFPQAYDNTTGSLHYFGSLRGDATNDDAWDEGVILPMIARGVLYSSTNMLTAGSNRTFSVPSNLLYPISTPMTDLSPDLARIEGLADGMAAAVIKTPYLADTQGTSLAVTPVLDIRDIHTLSTSQKSPFSVPALRAFSWEIILKANNLPTPGVPTDWAKIDPLATVRFFMAPKSLTNQVSSGGARDFEPLNIYTQISRIREAVSGTDTVDLNARFTEAILTSLATPFGIPWPRPVAGPLASFASDWGVDPSSPFPLVTLSMAQAAKVDMPYLSSPLNAPRVISYQPAFPNLSTDEVFYSCFNLNADKRCVLSATITPALAADSKIEVDLPSMSRTITLLGTGGTSEVMTFPGNNSTPTPHPVRIRVINTAAVQPDIVVKLELKPAP
jgi:hypothetical protein